MEIIWQGKPISNVKNFGKLNCTLCMRERLEIYKALEKDKKNGTCNVINSRNELYGACRHIPRFHRYKNINDFSADEAKMAEKGSDVER